jgi:hypothetical protein
MPFKYYLTKINCYYILKKQKMLSELNGQENYFTRISTAGLLNVRKIELTQMLLQDINIFHTHPTRMPDANLDTSRLVASAITSMELNEKRTRLSINLKDPFSSCIAINKSMTSLATATTPTLTTNLMSPCGHGGSSSALSRSSNNLTLIKANSGGGSSSPLVSSLRTSRNELSSSSQLLSPKATTSLTANPTSQASVIPTSTAAAAPALVVQTATVDEMVTGLNDISSFQLYAANRPTGCYRPIREQLPFAPTLSSAASCTTAMSCGGGEPRLKHNVSYLKLDGNNALDYNTLQQLHNGFTFVCVLNEWDMHQSNYLLNIRLERDNSTLIWSRPAWDINNTWINSGITNAAVAAANNNAERSSDGTGKTPGNPTVSEAARFT